MTANPTDFRRGVIAPMACIKEGWALIKHQYWLFFGISLVGVLIGGMVPIVLLGPMMVGIFLCLQQRQRNQPVEFGLLFKGFDQFVPALVAAVLKLLPIMILMIPYYIFIFAMMVALPHGRNSNPDESRTFFLSFFGFEMIFVLTIIVISVVLETFFMFAFPLIADRKMSGLEAVKLSFKAAKANFGGVLGLILLNGLFSIIGALCCIVGVYFYLAVAFAAQAVAYRRVFPEIVTEFSAPPAPGSWAA